MQIDRDEIETIKGLLLKGATTKAVLEVTGLTYFRYKKLLSERADLIAARSEGKFKKRNNLGNFLGVKLGGVGPSLKGYDKAFVDWIACQVPEGGTVADVIVSSAYDAFLEEQDALTGTNSAQGKTP